MSRVVEVKCDLPIVAVGNQRWHHFKVHSYHKQRKLLAWSELRAAGVGQMAGRVTVKMTRYGVRPLDSHDNLRQGFKGAVDGVALWLCAPDNHPDIEWVYDQVTGSRSYGWFTIRVEWA